MKVGDRVRITGGGWASDCGTITKVLVHTIKVRLDTRGRNIRLRKRDRGKTYSITRR